MNRLAEMTVWLVPAAVALSGLALGLALRRVALPWLARFARRSAWRYDEVIIEAVRGPVVVWGALLGLHIALRLLPIDQWDRALGRAALALAVLSVTWAGAGFTVGVIRAATAAGGLKGVSLIANVSRVVVFTIGVLIVLQSLGISITPIITALGVGGLAVGLALQDTLANFFAGLRILAAGRVRPGDYIKLDSGEEGFVEDITWASTSLRELPNSLVIVPNAKLASALTTNYALPDPEQAVLVQVGVSYGSDLAKVERVTGEVAAGVLREVEGGVRTFEPFIRYHTFGDSSINFTVILRATHHTNRFLLIHEFIKRLHARFAAEGIQIPFPQREVHLGTPKPPAGTPPSHA